MYILTFEMPVLELSWVNIAISGDACGALDHILERERHRERTERGKKETIAPKCVRKGAFLGADVCPPVECVHFSVTHIHIHTYTHLFIYSLIHTYIHTYVSARAHIHEQT